MGLSAAPPSWMRPVKIARPRVAAAPQHRVAVAMNRYPRILPRSDVLAAELELIVFLEEFVDSIWVKADQDLCANHKGRRCSAVVSPDQLEDGPLVRADVLFGELHSSSLEDCLHGKAGWSAGLCEEYHFPGFSHGSPQI